MKRWVLLAAAILIVVGAGSFLLNTRQAPDVPEPPAPEYSLASPSVTDAVPAMPSITSDVAVVSQLSTDQFRALGAEVMRALPTKKELKGEKGEEIQGPSSSLITAGIELGKIAQAVADEPALEMEAITLYRECAVSPQHPDSVRALCYSGYKKLASKTTAGFNEKLVSKSLRQLSEKLDL